MKRRTGFFLILAAAVPLAVASTAYACANLATLYLNKSGGKPGTVVRGEGRNYFTGNSLEPVPAAVTVRLDRRTGRILWQGRPDANGRIRPSFAIPRARAGYHTLLATQQRANGRPHAGTPGRATIKISGTTMQGGVAAPWGSAKPEQPGGGTGGASPVVGSLPGPVTLGGFLLALALAGSGVVVLAGAQRRGGLAPTAPTGVSG